jgi:hypothetical protein
MESRFSPGTWGTGFSPVPAFLTNFQTEAKYA